jgi:hypothetical protein
MSGSMPCHVAAPVGDREPRITTSPMAARNRMMGHEGLGAISGPPT